MNPVTWAALLGAIGLEVLGTTLLQQSQQFTRPWPTAGLALCYGLAFYLLTIALKQMPVGLAYAIWSGPYLQLFRETELRYDEITSALLS